MLLKIREKSRGIIAYFIVGLIALAFSMWGMDSLFTAMRGDPNEVASINGESISQRQVDRYAQQQMRQLMQSGQIDPDRIDMNQLRQFALSQLVQEELLRQQAKQLNMRISDQMLDRQLVQFDAFRNDAGRFDREIYTQRLRQQGLSPSDFRAQLREDLLNQQLLDGFAVSEFMLDQEVEDFQRLVGQQRDYRYFLIRAENFMDQIDISDADVEAFYEAETERFMASERVRVDYLIFDPSSLLAGMEVTDQELEEEYQRFAAAFGGGSSYSAAHILLSFDNAAERQQALETLEQARDEILAGADFGELASELSEDRVTARRGGQLGTIEEGSLDPDFEQALFALEEVGDLSGVVETDFGLHLIQLTDLERAEAPPFEEVKEELRERLLAQPLRAATSDKLEELSNLSFSSEAISEVASATSLELQTSDWLITDQLEGFWAEADVAAELFSEEVIEDGWITEPLRLEDGRYLVLAKNDHQPRQARPLQEVADEVRAELKRVEAQALAEQETERLQQALEAGESLDVDWETLEAVSRNSRSVSREINQAAFRINLDETPTRLVSLVSGDVALIELLNVTEGEVSTDPDEVRQIRRMLAEDKGNRLQSQFIQQLESKADIEYR
ncbi:peptidyl-prolyl cis-trans isomerase D [Marinospirillum celere]|uniref:Periplasmic chaperone PpiD n=1 Tax=Marinospirillum celere TaxID=1122252 RepID=A0A1I1EBT4_9GAMM|nr:SurA N-terminal domain-containing protein [Marinospirillum celere]SFB82848.1 peptidyl-prolyl cis-trans isomerase D [Marinospirillum celere]